MLAARNNVYTQQSVNIYTKQSVNIYAEQSAPPWRVDFL